MVHVEIDDSVILSLFQDLEKILQSSDEEQDVELRLAYLNNFFGVRVNSNNIENPSNHQLMIYPSDCFHRRMMRLDEIRTSSIVRVAS